MSVVGRMCNQFQGLLRTGTAASALQSDQCLIWNQSKRFYTRKSNLARKAKKAQERALNKKEFKYVKLSNVARPFPVDNSADKEPSTDDVWFRHLHPLRRITFEEAINFHRESVHESVFNNPDAFVNVVVVLNLKTKKEGVNLDKIKGFFMPAHLFPAGRDIRILALCKELVDVVKATEAGAFSAGGLELIKSIEEGNLQVEEYDTVVAHSDVLTYLAPIRGLLKTKFPKVAHGTMGRDIANIVTKVKESRSYNLIRDSEDQSTGWVDDIIGKIDMPMEHLADNLHVYLRGFLSQQPRTANTPFIIDLFVRCPPSDEVFLLDRLSVLKEEVRTVGVNKTEIIQTLIKEEEEEEEEEEDGETKKVAEN